MSGPSFLPQPMALVRCFSRPVKSGGSHQNGSSMASQPGAGLVVGWWCHRSCPWGFIIFPASAEAAPQELSTVVTPFLPQPTAFMKHHCKSCPTGTVHSGSTSSPASLSIPTDTVPQQKPASARKGFSPSPIDLMQRKRG